MKSSTDILFHPHSFGSKMLLNRIVMAPMTRKQSPSGIPTKEVAAYYSRRGAGGTGLIFSEGTFIDHPSAQAHEGNAYENIPHFFGRDALQGWQRIITSVHKTGALFVPQLWHVGEVRRLGMANDPEIPGYGPRQILNNGTITVKAMDTKDCEEIANSYARCARRARDMECDGIALHGAHGYLLDQFFWPETNNRTDQFGGSMENRCRFACLVVEKIRQAVGSSFPIVFRFSQWKMTNYDTDAILLAIRIATYGETMDITYQIPVINETQAHTINLPALLENIRNIDIVDEATTKKGFKIKIAPLDYKTLTKIQTAQFEQQKIYATVTASNLTEQAKSKQFVDSFNKLNNINFSLLIESIKELTTPGGDKVTDVNQIKEFCNNCETAIINEIQEKLSEIRVQAQIKPLIIKATEEQVQKGVPETYNVPVTFDNSNFFG